MKVVLLILVWILSSSCVPRTEKPEHMNTPLPEEPGSMISVASFNVHKSVGTDWHCLPNRIIQVVKELGYHVIAGPTMLRQGGFYGNAILTRYEPHSIRIIDLSVPGREPRGALEAVLLLGPKRIRVIVTHLGLSRRERNLQIERLCRSVPRDGAETMVLLGDFNEWAYWGKIIQLLHHNFGHSKTLCTFPSFLPFIALDRIVVQPEWALVETRVHSTPLSRVASDHLPVKAIIHLD